MQRGGFASEQDAAAVLERELERLRRERRVSRSLTLAAVAASLAPRYGPMVIFAAATGLRPAEWLALERRDVDWDARVVYARRSFTKGRLKCTKTEASRRAVPLQTVALEAIEHLLASPHSPLLFPAERGGYLDLHNFRDSHSGRAYEQLLRTYEQVEYARYMAAPPQTLYGIADSPVGLAAWLLDHNDADGQPAAAVAAALERAKSDTGELTRDEVLDNITLYNEVDKGGHFAAWEQPELFSSELRAAFRSLR